MNAAFLLGSQWRGLLAAVEKQHALLRHRRDCWCQCVSDLKGGGGGHGASHAVYTTGDADLLTHTHTQTHKGCCGPLLKDRQHPDVSVLVCVTTSVCCLKISLNELQFVGRNIKITELHLHFQVKIHWHYIIVLLNCINTQYILGLSVDIFSFYCLRVHSQRERERDVSQKNIYFNLLTSLNIQISINRCFVIICWTWLCWAGSDHVWLLLCAISVMISP